MRTNVLVPKVFVCRGSAGHTGQQNTRLESTENQSAILDRRHSGELHCIARTL